MTGVQTCALPILRLDGTRWQGVWSSPGAGWRNIEGTISFIGDGISELVIKSSSFCYKDEKSSIFIENSNGPRRWFIDTWIRQGDRYVLKTATTIPSAYNTLVEFIYALSTGNYASARSLTDNNSLIDRAIRLKMIQKPLGQEWGIETSQTEDEYKGPLVISLYGPDSAHNAGRLEVKFANENGHYYISAIEPLR